MRVRSWPATVTFPAEGRSIPPRMPIRVDLPLPDAPTIATISPAWTTRSRPCSAWTSRSATLKIRTRFSQTITGGRPSAAAPGRRAHSIPSRIAPAAAPRVPNRPARAIEIAVSTEGGTEDQQEPDGVEHERDPQRRPQQDTQPERLVEQQEQADAEPGGEDQRDAQHGAVLEREKHRRIAPAESEHAQVSDLLRAGRSGQDQADGQGKHGVGGPHQDCEQEHDLDGPVQGPIPDRGGDVGPAGQGDARSRRSQRSNERVAPVRGRGQELVGRPAGGGGDEGGQLVQRDHRERAVGLERRPPVAQGYEASRDRVVLDHEPELLADARHAGPRGQGGGQDHGQRRRARLQQLGRDAGIPRGPGDERRVGGHRDGEQVVTPEVGGHARRGPHGRRPIRHPGQGARHQRRRQAPERGAQVEVGAGALPRDDVRPAVQGLSGDRRERGDGRAGEQHQDHGGGAALARGSPHRERGDEVGATGGRATRPRACRPVSGGPRRSRRRSRRASAPARAGG